MSTFFTAAFKFVDQLDDNLQLSFAYNAYDPENNNSNESSKKRNDDYIRWSP